jgi:hypothetical protein
MRVVTFSFSGYVVVVIGASRIDGRHLFRREFTEDAPNSPFVDQSQLIDQRGGLFGENTLAKRESRIEDSLRRRPS